MTDTTDIAALREKYELALKDLTERLMECNRLNYCMDEITAFAAFSSTLIDQLEAERQRADELQTEIDRVKQQSRNRLQGLCKAGDERDKAESELAALKVEQVPVACESDEVICSWGRDNHINGGADRLRNVIKSAIKLFTAPQKPVVLPKIRDSKYWGGVEFRCDKYQLDIQAAIEAAGGIVKDGE